MPIVTEHEAIEHVKGFEALSAIDKAQYLQMSEVYLLARNVKPYEDFTQLPEALKQLVIKSSRALLKVIYIKGQEPALKRKKVKAETVETVKEYQNGSVKLSAIEQFILDLIKLYNKRQSVFFVRKT